MHPSLHSIHIIKNNDTTDLIDKEFAEISTNSKENLTHYYYMLSLYDYMHITVITL